MRPFALLAAIGILLTAQISQGQSVKEQRYDLGKRICAMVLEGELEAIAGKPYRETIDRTLWDRAEYCHCVGEEFADDPTDRHGLLRATGDDEAHAMQAKIEDALQSCLPGSGNMADLAGTDYAHPDEDADDGESEADARLCEQAIEGGILLPGFDDDAVRVRMRASRQDRAMLCACSAKHMAVDPEAFDAEVEAAANPSIVYGSKLAGAINMCLD